MMKIALASMLFLLVAVSGHAQILEVTASGTVTSTVGTTNVQDGDPVTATFDISLATMGTQTGTGAMNYTQFNVYSSFQAGSFDLSSASAVSSVTIFSTGAGYYGYQERSTFNQTTPIYSDIVLLSNSHPEVAPTMNLSSFQQFLAQDFDTQIYMNFINNQASFGVNASLTSYTVKTLAAPEPASYLLGLLALGTAVLLVGRFRQTKIGA